MMQEAVDKLVGEHDYRNFCKMDVGNGVVNYTRKIVSAEITTVDEGYVLTNFHFGNQCFTLFLYHKKCWQWITIKEMSWCIVTCSVLIDREEGYQMCELTIVGLAFLWHQIRCIVALLFMIGQGKEKPEVGGEHYCPHLSTNLRHPYGN